MSRPQLGRSASMEVSRLQRVELEAAERLEELEGLEAEQQALVPRAAEQRALAMREPLVPFGERVEQEAQTVEQLAEAPTAEVEVEVEVETMEQLHWQQIHQLPHSRS